MSGTIDALTEANRDRLARLETALGYRFRNAALLQRALIHSSYAFEQGKSRLANNETLEFLGDAVLDLAVGFLLFQRFPAMREGELSKLRAALVNEGHLMRMADELGLGDYLLLGRGEETSRGRRKPSILACAYEAVIGAVYLDGGYEPALAMVAGQYVGWVDEGQKILLEADAKSRLQELCQERYNEAPSYVLESEEGPAHDKRFTVSVRFRGEILATGTAKSKKEAEQRAAAVAVENFVSESPA